MEQDGQDVTDFVGPIGGYQDLSIHIQKVKEVQTNDFVYFPSSFEQTGGLPMPSWLFWRIYSSIGQNGLLSLFCLALLLPGWPGWLAAQEKGRDGLVPASSVSGPGTTRAVVVGISDYQHPDIPDLRFAHRDAEAFAGWLQSKMGNSTSVNNLHVLTNSEASASKVYNEILWLLEESQPGDEAILYFSGHGDIQQPLTQIGFLLCHDATPKLYGAGGTISTHILREAIQVLVHEKMSKITLILDACHSGKLKGSIQGGPQINLHNILNAFEGSTKLLACQPNEVSLEGSQWGGGHGVFSFGLLSALNGKADLDNNLEITLYELRRYLEDYILTQTKPILQHPVVEGDPDQIITIMDAPEVSFSGNSGAPEKFYKIEEKSYEDFLFGTNDSSLITLVATFKATLETINDTSTSLPFIDSIYTEIQLHPELTVKSERYLRRYYAAAIQDGAQQFLLNLFNNEMNTVTSGYEILPRLKRYPTLLNRAAELLSPSHPMFSEIKSREHFFIGLSEFIQRFQNRDSISSDKVMSAYLESLRWKPESPLTLYGISMCQATIMYNPDEAIETIRQIRLLAPSWTLPAGKLAYYLVRYHKRYKDAAKLIEENLSIDSTCMTTWNALGALYHYLPNVSKAIQTYEFVISLDSTNAVSWSNLGVEYLRKGNWTKSEQAFLKALDINPNQAMAHHSLGSFYRLKNDFPLAKSYFYKALELSPRRITTMDSLSSILLLEKNFQHCLLVCDSILSIHPDYAGALYKKAVVYRDLNDLEMSKSFLLKAITSDPKYRQEILKDQKWSKLPDISTY